MSACCSTTRAGILTSFPASRDGLKGRLLAPSIARVPNSSCASPGRIEDACLWATRSWARERGTTNLHIRQTPLEHTVTTTTPIRSADPEQYETVRASVPARPRAPHAPAWPWVLRTEQRVLDVLARIGIPVLRLSLAFVYVAFGALKIAGLSPVGELVASMVPFLPETPAVIAMG